MKIKLKKLSFLFAIMLIGSLLATSCVPKRKMMYLQTTKESDTARHFVNERSARYLIQPGDNLYIKVVSLDEKTATLFNPLEKSGGAQNVNDQGIYLNSYTVSDEGNIEFPLAGNITVQNLDVEQIKVRIQTVLDQYLKETVLIVKLVNFNLTILGEVRRPGQYKVYQSKINIFEAMAMAGDLTEFADRMDVQIIRQTKTGSQIIPINLEEARILSSENYFLKPNDMIYIKPLKIKQYGFATFPYALIFSTISTALLLINFFK
jgi:polysaccharide export outer membrane protein